MTPTDSAQRAALAVTLETPADSHSQSANSKRLTTSKKSQPQQLKHALNLNAAHVITHDYLTLRQPLSDGIMLMDRTERRLVMVRSLGELLPLRSYNTEYGNELKRVSKYKAQLADSIELDVTSDEADWDTALGRIALDAHAQAGGHPADQERMAAYKAFAAPAAAPPAAAPAAASSGAPPSRSNGKAPEQELTGERLREKEAISKMEAVQLRMSEIERWFASIKAEAANERQMREQATLRTQLLQERLERIQEQLMRVQAENATLRQRVADVATAESSKSYPQ